MTDFSARVNLAARRLGTSVVAASDEFFGEKENLLRSGPPVSQPGTFGHKGQVVDGWETRRRRGSGHDFALIRLGAGGVIHSVVVDTAHFTGNFPAACSVRACAVDGHPSPAELLGPGVQWAEIVPRSDLAGDTENNFAAADSHRFTHVQLNIYPDGGVARLRVHGEVVPDPRLLEGIPLDLVAEENGGTVVDASDRFYSAPENMIAPGRAAVMGDGWETRRRRGSGNDWALFKLAACGHIRQVVVDTSCFLGNAPATAAVQACDASGTGLDAAEWFDLVPRIPLRPDTRHRFRIGSAAALPVSHVRLDIYPDGGLARFRLFGEPTTGGRACLGLRWFDRLPADYATRILADECGLAEAAAAELVGRRPYRRSAQLDALLTGGGPLPGLNATAARQVRFLLLGSPVVPEGPVAPESPVAPGG